MAVSTLLVCDEPAKCEQLQALISSEPRLRWTGTATKEDAANQVLQQGPCVIWIELAPEPAKALTLLGELKETYPALQFLVSYDKLQPDLVKSAMQLGAIEYVDPESAQRLLPDAIERIVQKLNQAVLGTGTKPSTPGLPPSGDGRLPTPAGGRQVSGVRGEMSQMDGGPGMLPNWMLPSIMITLLLIAIILFLSGHH